MFLDIISSRIYLKHNGYNNHSSTLGMLLTFSVGLLITAFSIYSLRELWERKLPITNGIVKITDDAGIYKLGGSNGFSHAFWLRRRDNSEIDYFDQKAVVVDATLKSINGTILGTYFYDTCNWEIDGPDMKGLITKKDLEMALCIRKFVNETLELENTITNKDKFPWPEIRYGLESKFSIDDQTAYYIEVKECVGKSNCYSRDKVEEFYQERSFQMSFIDRNFDFTNYSSPVTYTLNTISGYMLKLNYISNHMNFFPSSIESNDGIILPKVHTYRDIKLSYNERGMNEKADSIFLTKVNWWLKNQESIIYRRYLTLQDLLASIGGFFNFIYYIALIINYIPSKYVIIRDSLSILNSINVIPHSNNLINKNHINSNLIVNKDSNQLNISVEKFNDSKFKLKESQLNQYELNNENNNVNKVKLYNKNDLINENAESQYEKNKNMIEGIITKNCNMTEKNDFSQDMKFSFSKKILFIYFYIKDKFYKRIEEIRDNVLSEQNLFKSYFILMNENNNDSVNRLIINEKS